jgi:hypothetical protein
MTKQHILAEIRRTAEGNGGVPLGRERFFQETGIKESDWSGVYWARWSDSIEEAGFAANRLQGAYDEDLLLERYAALVRELGKVPVNPELRLKRRTDPTFPSHNTFARFGDKQRLLTRVIEFCRSRSNLGDVVQICLAQIQEPNLDSRKHYKLADDEFGFVYLIQSGRFYKIGRTNALGRREYELSIQLPEKAVTLHSIRTDDPIGIEAYWHKRFESRRKNGEWFELTREDVAAFKRRKFM